MSFCQGRISILSLQTSLDLWESLIATHTVLEAANGEVVGLRARLVEPDRRVVGQCYLLLKRRPLFRCL